MTRLAQRYQLDDPIGQGGMGTVFKGRDLQTGELVAVKRLKPEAVKADPQILERFEREGEALRRLNHPNIVKVLATLADKKDHYIVLEYISGGDLGDMLKARGRLSIERTLQIGIELSDALTRAHYLKIVHRDIKPANVLVTEDGVPKLTDFGVAHIGGAGSMTGAGLAIGTPDYMSPEAVNGDEADDRSDIWSLGVMLFEMLTGKHPFRADAVTGTLVNILTQPHPDLEQLRPDAPIALVDLIDRMLQKDIKTRISSVRLVGAELEAIMRGRAENRRTTLTTPISVPAIDNTRFETPTPPTAAPKHNLPAQTTPFIGRAEELEDLATLMSQPDTRLMTVLGQGGMGKTRLALQAAEMFLHAFEHGVYFVPLASLLNADGLPMAVADAVGMTINSDGRPPLQHVADYLHEKNTLLVFDNFEQVLDGAEMVSELLRAAPHLKIIVTSRERLNLTGETIVALGGLDLPDPNNLDAALYSSAVQLFVQSARRSSPGFELSDSDLRHVVRICRSVDGMPLGVVLAASWTDSLSVVEIADEITRSIDFLESELRDLPARHRSMRAVFDYSWNLLNDSDREIFARLSVFRGGFTREAAQHVTGASLRALTALVNKSLVRRHPDSGRYELHELVRQYGEARLHDTPAVLAEVQAKHAEYYADFLAKRSNIYAAIGQELHILEEIEADRDNVRAAWEYALDNRRADLIERSMDVVAMFFESKGAAKEASKVFHEVADALSCLPDVNPVLVARAKLHAGQMETVLGENSHAEQDAKAALAVFEQHDYAIGIGKATNALSYIAMNQGQYEHALELLERSVQALRRSGHPYAPLMINRVEASVAYVLFLQGEFSKSEHMYRDLIRQNEAKGSKYANAYLYNNLGEVLHAQNRDDEARPLFQKAYDINAELKNLRWQAVALVNLGLVAHAASRFAEAEAYFRRALPIYKEIGDKRGVAEALNRIGSTVYWYGRYSEAIELYEKAYHLFTEVNNPKGAADTLVLCSIAQNAIGQYDQARESLLTAFELRGRLGNISDIADVQQIIAVNAMYRGDYDEALMYLEQSFDMFSSNPQPDVINSTRYQLLRGIILCEAGRYDEAIPQLENSIAILEANHVYWALAQGMGSLGIAYIHVGRAAEALPLMRRAVGYGVKTNTPDWTTLAIVAAGWVIAVSENAPKGVEYISYVLNSQITQRFIRDRAQRAINGIRPLLSPAEFDRAWERGKSLDHNTVVNAIMGKTAEV
jgi:predicted ATPase/Tfp pilus assembly protein PilF